MRLRRLTAILAFLALLALLTVSASAAESRLSYVYSAPCGEATETYAEAYVPISAVQISCGDTLPTVGAGTATALDGGTDEDVLSVELDSDDHRASLTFDVDSDMTDPWSTGAIPDSLGFCMVIPRGESPENTTADVIIRIKSEKSMYTYRVAVATGVPVLVLCDTSRISYSDTLEKVTLTVSCGGMRSVPSTVYMSFPFITEACDFSFQRENEIEAMSVLSGSVLSRDGKLTVLAEADDMHAVISFSSPMNDRPQLDLGGGRIAYLTSVVERGSASLSLLDSEGGTPSSVTEGGKLILRLSETGDATDATLSIRPADEQGIIFSGLSFFLTDELDTESKHIISSITLTGGELSVEGKLSEHLVEEYLGEELGLYMRHAVGGGADILLENVSVASRFSYKTDLKKHAGAAYQSLFFVGVESEEGNIIPISEPRFATPKSHSTASGSHFGLYGADPVSVYESGAPKVMIDVDLSRLLSTNTAAGSTVTRGGYVFGINSEYASSLDSDIGFYTSSGTAVYLKFICTELVRSSNGGWLVNPDSESHEYLVLTRNDEGMNFFLAAVEYLCERYSGIESIVISSGINSKSLTGNSPKNIYSYVTEIALLSRLVYGAAAGSGADVFITVPLAESDAFVSSELFGALLSERLSVIGQIPWAPMYTVRDGEAYPDTDFPATSAKNNGTAAPSFSVLCWTPTGDGATVAERYSDLCDSLNSPSVRTIFLSLKELSTEPSGEDFRLLRQSNMTEGTLLLYKDTVCPSEMAQLPIVGRYKAWDFASLYSADGWRAGYGISSLGTVELPSGRRVLRCITEAGGGESSGIMLCPVLTPDLISASPIAEFVYSYSGEGAVQITFLFGLGENKAEFTCAEAELLPDGRYRSVCDLSEFASSVPAGYVGIVIKGEGEVTFELNEVSFASVTHTDAELAELVENNSDGDKSRMSMRALTAIVFGGILCTAVFVRILVTLLRYDREAALQKKNSHKKAGKK